MVCVVRSVGGGAEEVVGDCAVCAPLYQTCSVISVRWSRIGSSKERAGGCRLLAGKILGVWMMYSVTAYLLVICD